MSRRALVSLMLFALVCGPTRSARGDPYRLRADAFYSAEPSVGFLSLQAEQRERSFYEAEALVWTGAGDVGSGDAEVIAIRVRDPLGRGELRVGRMLLTTGAVRPLHLDGAYVMGRAPWGTGVELFGGMPVVPRFGSRDYDWALGQRTSQRLGTTGVVGLSYLQERTAGAISYEEVGLDASAAPVKWLDAAMLGAYDVVSPGVTEARASVAAHERTVRAEFFVLRRSPSRILPATSLFSALGDVPSDQLGAAVTWHAAPRLDVFTQAAGQSIGGSPGLDQRFRVTLRFDDRGAGALSVEARRDVAPDATWSGVRTAIRYPIDARTTASTELEIARPDDPSRGRLWPWGLIAILHRPAPLWELAAAAEASASPQSVGSLTVLAHIARTWVGP